MYPRRFGCLIPALHNPNNDPYISLRDDAEVCVVADRLGFDEFWIGEHHSGGWGSLSAPELVLASLAGNTRHIRLGTGVVPLPYHHPLHVAERILLLDHLSHGRAILGCGSGAFVQDMDSIGVDYLTVKEHFGAALCAVSSLLKGQVVDVETEWFTLRDGRTQLRPFRSDVEVAVATTLSDPSIAAIVANGASPLVNLTAPYGAVRPGTGTDPIPALAERFARWRTCAPSAVPIRLNVFVYVCESRESGVADIMPGWQEQRVGLFRSTLGVPIPKSESSNQSTLEALIANDGFVVGSPTECVAQIKSIAEKLGGFDNLAVLVPDWLPLSKTLSSLEKFAREVAPHFSGSNSGLVSAVESARAKSGLMAEKQAAILAPRRVEEPVGSSPDVSN